MPDGEVIKRGEFLYDGAVQTDVRIVAHATTYGSGDYEDPPEMQYDRDIPSFAIEWGSPGERGVFRSGVPNFSTLPATSHRSVRYWARADRQFRAETGIVGLS